MKELLDDIKIIDSAVKDYFFKKGVHIMSIEFKYNFCNNTFTTVVNLYEGLELLAKEFNKDVSLCRHYNAIQIDDFIFREWLAK